MEDKYNPPALCGVSCLYIKVVSEMGGTGFVGVGRCPAETDGSAMATSYLSKYSYLGLALASGQECELDTLLAHKNKEAVKYIVIFIFFFTSEILHKALFLPVAISYSLDCREEDPNFMHFSIISLYSCDHQVVVMFLFLVAACRDLIKRRNSL